MLARRLTRRQFVASSSLAVAAAAVPIAGHWSGAQAPSLLVSAERVGQADVAHSTVVLDGPRIARLQAMADSLPIFTDVFVLRLDSADDHLVDVAAQQAGVSVKRLLPLPDGMGIRARVIRQGRNFA